MKIVAPQSTHPSPGRRSDPVLARAPARSSALPLCRAPA
ncbi:uncharacterized protein SOCE836_003100 [Sorangium cellulosum]|uniref:Uncharacterized protein n=1 Tax=Sorangium cellulosum TaxID=56 RepID=A0A4V0NF30_SORCE|nr:uncharacterized protein SOCE836_003100 [Sorangium cellulosum]